MRLSIISRIFILSLVIFFHIYPLSSQTVHHVNLWGGAGYSSLLHGIDNTKVPGGFGWEFGVGYQLDLDRFMLNVGAEFQQVNSTTRLMDYSPSYQFQYIGPGIPVNQPHHITYWYHSLSYEEKHSLGYVNIPLMAGIRFSRYYALLGAKVGLNLIGNYKLENTTFRISADDPQFIEQMEGIQHGTGDQSFSNTGKMSLGLNVAPSVEFGVYLNDWLPRGMTRLGNARNTPLTYRAGVFLDYGVLNINTSGADQPMVSEPRNNDPSAISLSPLGESTLAHEKNFHTLVAGVKLTVQFQLSRNKKPKPIPPSPNFYARVVDELSLEPLSGEVILNMTAGRREEIFRGTTDSDGLVMKEELKAGRYQLTSTSEGYTTYRKMIRHAKADTLLIPMKQPPVFYVQVSDAESHQNLKAEVTLTPGNTTKPALKAETDPGSGLVSGTIRTGRYQLSVTSEGYIYHQEIINYTKTDTVHVALQPIKKDVVVVLHELFFALNEAVILPESEAAMEDLYQFLSNNPSVSIKITGHTDNTGRLEYNMQLSKNRAKAVYDSLVERGIDSSRISYEGKGPNDPVASNETEEGRALNRRVEFVIQ